MRFGASWRISPPARPHTLGMQVLALARGQGIRELVSHTIRILLVDDYEPFRRFVRATLQARPELQVIGEASDGLEAVQKAEELKPDLILLDVGLPTLNGIKACHRMSKVVPDSRILFVTQNNDADMARSVLGNGARGYVLKVDANSELLLAVEAILRGEQFISTGVNRNDGICERKQLSGLSASSSPKTPLPVNRPTNGGP